jgi:hypothetical protein
VTRYKQGKKVSEQKRIVRKTNLKRVALALLLALVGLTAYVFSYQYTHQAKIEAELRVKQTQVQSQIQQIKAKSNLNAEQQKQIEELNKQKQELEKQLQAKKESARVLAEAQATPAPVPQVSGAVANCGDNAQAHYIYMHESGCRLDAVNSIGCIGIGQSCPGGSGLARDCPDWRTNYACQNAHFTRYANRYGGWQGAYNAWLSKHWW